MKTLPDPPASPQSPPRILLVEDDPTSRAFLTAALQAIPAEVDAADSLAGALALLGGRHYDLWMFDANLPDGDGRDLLARARLEQPDAMALAHTASNDAEVRGTLLAAGFRDVLIKPMPASAVQWAVRHALGLGAPTESMGTVADTQPTWDDVAATAALNGNQAHVAILRQLFIAELPQTRERILAAARSGDRDSVQAELHKLRASCGFVGAARLADTVRALQSQPDATDVLECFDRAALDIVERSGNNDGKPDYS
ncbi:response regulator [Lysobacter sp. F6437]|uniref:response regulator n=1 Tax=Lysobacter sp. F6437 TaxID=3459296 RepID=UPI00403D5F90